MTVIKVSIPSYWGGGQRLDQFLHRDGTLEGCRLVIDKSLRNADAWVVIDDLDEDDALCRVPGNKLFFVSAEQVFPDDYFLTPQMSEFVGQFFVAVNTYAMDHPRPRITAPFLPWMVNGPGVFERHERDLDHLLQMKPKSAKAGVSVICSTKTITPGHVVRLDFVQRLKRHFGEDLTWFGTGVNPIEQKWDGLEPFLASVAIENRISPDMYSEKLIDPLLTFTVPLYAGPPNIHKYFPIPDQWLLDPRDFDDAKAKVANILERGLQENDIEILHELRELALGPQHFLRRIVALTESTGTALPPEDKHLRRPEWPRATRGSVIRSKLNLAFGGR